jgi:Zn-dependent protease with chaperone function
VSGTFSARYFDGRHSRPFDVLASVVDGRIRLAGAEIERDYALSDTRVSERLQSAPRLLTFSDGSYCEVSDHERLDAVLASTGFRDSWVVRWQNRWPYAVVALLASIAVVAAGYFYGLPKFAEVAARRISPEFEAAIGRQAVEWIDEHLFTPTELPQARRAALAAKFAAIAPRDGRAYRLEFRKSRIGPNAVALPGGIIVMTDELVKLAPDDEGLLGVLAHELGHIEQRHFLRRVITSTVTGAVATLIAGEASGVLTAVPATLADLSYSRDMEREADRYAIELLRANQLPTEPLAQLLERLEQAHTKRTGKRERGSSWTDYVSTHPDTEERARLIREAR